MRLRRNSAANRKASSENRKVFSEESEGFFRRALGSYTHKFTKCGAASLTYLPRLDLPRSRLDLPRSRLGLLRLRLSRNSGPATEGFSNCGINFKDAYRSSDKAGKFSIYNERICIWLMMRLASVKAYGLYNLDEDRTMSVNSNWIHPQLIWMDFPQDIWNFNVILL